MASFISPEIVGKLFYPTLVITAFLINQLKKETRLTKKKIGFFFPQITSLLPRKQNATSIKHKRARKFRFHNHIFSKSNIGRKPKPPIN